MRIALCSYSPKEEETSTLMQIGEVIRFDRGSFVAYALRSGRQYDVIIVMGDDARGMNDCMTIREIDSKVPIIWVSNQNAFFAQSVRLHIDLFLTKPVSTTHLKEEVLRLTKQLVSNDR